MYKIKVLKQVGKVIAEGVYGDTDINNDEFARQLVEKKLAELIDGEIPKRKIVEVKPEIKPKVKKKNK